MEMEEEEKRKIREFLKKVDKKYYRPDIERKEILVRRNGRCGRRDGRNYSSFGGGVTLQVGNSSENVLVITALL